MDRLLIDVALKAFPGDSPDPKEEPQTVDQPFNLRTFQKSEIVAILERNFTHRDFASLNRRWKLIAVDEVAGSIMLLLDMQQAEIDRLRKRVAELETFSW